MKKLIAVAIVSALAGAALAQTYRTELYLRVLNIFDVRTSIQNQDAAEGVVVDDDFSFTGAGAGTTPAANDNDTSLATTAYVQGEIDDLDFLSDNCALQNDSTPIPDSCVGDGTDDSGGGGTPGGSDTQVQYNDGGSFGGDAGLVYDEATNALTGQGPIELVYSAARILIDDSSGTNNSCVQFQDNNVTNAFLCAVNANGSVTTSSVAGDLVLRADSGSSARLLWTPDAGTTTHDLTPLSGTFTANFINGCSTTPTITFDYQKVGNIVTIVAVSDSGFPCTGDLITFTSDIDVPAAIRPAHLQETAPYTAFLNNGVATSACMGVSPAGFIAFHRAAGTNNACANGAWTNSGSRDQPTGTGSGLMTLTYMLGNP